VAQHYYSTRPDAPPFGGFLVSTLAHPDSVLGEFFNRWRYVTGGRTAGDTMTKLRRIARRKKVRPLLLLAVRDGGGDS
jgi:hypothetical protein